LRQRATLRDSSLGELMRTRRQPASEQAGRNLVTGAATPPAVRTIRRLVAALAAVALVAVAALAVSVWQLTRPGGRTVVTVSEPAAPAPARAPPRVVPVHHRTVTRARLVLTATRGACWLEVRTPATNGRVLYAGTLEQGQTAAFRRRRLFVELGAGGNVDATLNGRPVRLPTGTASVLVTARGIR
jgi:hypothetical protein